MDGSSLPRQGKAEGKKKSFQFPRIFIPPFSTLYSFTIGQSRGTSRLSPLDPFHTRCPKEPGATYKMVIHHPKISRKRRIQFNLPNNQFECIRIDPVSIKGVRKLFPGGVQI